MKGVENLNLVFRFILSLYNLIYKSLGYISLDCHLNEIQMKL